MLNAVLYYISYCIFAFNICLISSYQMQHFLITQIQKSDVHSFANIRVHLTTLHVIRLYCQKYIVAYCSFVITMVENNGLQ